MKTITVTVLDGQGLPKTVTVTVSDRATKTEIARAVQKAIQANK